MPTARTAATAANAMPDYPVTVAAADAFNDDTEEVSRVTTLSRFAAALSVIVGRAL